MTISKGETKREVAYSATNPCLYVLYVYEELPKFSFITEVLIIGNYRNYKKIALEDRDKIEALMQEGKSKTYISEILGCTKKTLNKALEYLNIEYNYYEKAMEVKNIILPDKTTGKKCTTCNKVKEMNDFYSENDNKYHSSCKECYREKARIKYHKRANDLNDYKSKIGCNKCKDKRGYVLDFHHKDPSTKSYTIAANPNVAIDSEKFLEEISKCVLLCANCHREFHHLENKVGITTEEYLSE